MFSARDSGSNGFEACHCVAIMFLCKTHYSPDFAIENEISRSIYGQTDFRLQSKQSTSGGGSFRLITETGLRFSFHLSESNLVPVSSAIFVLKKVIPRPGALSLWLDLFLDFRSS